MWTPSNCLKNCSQPSDAIELIVALDCTMWSGRDIEKKVAKALGCIGKGAAALSEAGTTVCAMSNAMQKQGLSGLLQPDAWSQDPKPRPRVAKSPVLPASIEPADIEEKRAILELRLDRATAMNDVLRAQSISRELDELKGATSFRPKADARMTATHSTTPSYQPFVARACAMHAVHAEHTACSAHSVPAPKPISKPPSTEGVASQPEHYDQHRPFCPSQPMECQAASAACPHIDSSATLQGAPYAFLGSVPYPHPYCFPMHCPHMNVNMLYGMQYGACQGFPCCNNDEAVLSSCIGRPATFMSGVSPADTGQRLASSYCPRQRYAMDATHPRANEFASPPVDSNAPQSATVSKSASTARVEELVDVNTHEATRGQSKMPLRSEAFPAPTPSPFELPIVVPMPAASPASLPRMAEDAQPSSGMLLLEMRTPIEPGAPDLVQSKPIANTPETAVEPAGNRVSGHNHVAQASVESKAETPPNGAPLQDIYEVETVLAMRQTENGKREFLIKWKGWGPTWNNWEPEEHILDRRMLRKFNKRAAVDTSPIAMNDSDSIALQSKRRCAKRATVEARKAACEEERHDDQDGDLEDF
jgi:hypothetical protein